MFKVGDKVKVHANRSSCSHKYNGKTGTIICTNSQWSILDLEKKSTDLLGILEYEVVFWNEDLTLDNNEWDT